MEHRRFPRVEAHAQQRILSYSSHNELVKNVVLSRNLSASGFCFRSSRAYEAGNELLVYFDDAVMEDIQVNRARVIKIGKYFLARVVWSRLVPLVSAPDKASNLALPVVSAGVRGPCEVRADILDNLNDQHVTGTGPRSHDIGCSFVSLSGGDTEKLEFFTRLVNHDMAHRMGQEMV